MSSVEATGDPPGHLSAKRLAAWFAVWVLPSILCFWLYLPGLRTWFQQDDFAWLGLLAQYRQGGGLWRLLFEPMAQGTIRPISERGFFLLFTSLFGFDALPFRIGVFLTEIGSLLLLTSIVLRLTRSRLAAAAAPMLWLVNAGLVVPMSWTSAYNQILCGFCILAAFRCYLKYIDTKHWKYYCVQLGLFILGLGVLEISVTYPLVAIAYTALLARPFLPSAVILLGPSVLFAVFHRLNAPLQAAPGYAIQVNARIVSTVLNYWEQILGPAQLHTVKHVPAWFAATGTVTLSVGLAGYVAYKTIKKQYVPLFFFAWIFILLAPVLPLPDHISDYYLTLPGIGLGVLGAMALADAWSGLARDWRPRALVPVAAVVGCLFLYVYSQLPVNRISVEWWYRRGRRVQAVVEGVVSAAGRHPGKTILLSGVENDLFWAAVYDRPYRLFGLSNVFLVPGSEQNLNRTPRAVDLSSYMIDARTARRALDQDEAVVYDASQTPIRNITTLFTRSVALSWPAGPSAEVEVANRLYAGQIGKGWYAPEQGFRWASPHAKLTLGRGDSTPGRVILSGYCTRVQTASGPLGVRLSANGISLGRRELRVKDESFELDFPLPASLQRANILDIAIDVERATLIPGESRKLGLAVTAVRLK